jgi:hypothetical protein
MLNLLAFGLMRCRVHVFCSQNNLTVSLLLTTRGIWGLIILKGFAESYD